MEVDPLAWRKKITKSIASLHPLPMHDLELVDAIRTFPLRKQDLGQLARRINLKPSQAAYISGLPLKSDRNLRSDSLLSRPASETIIKIIELSRYGIDVFDGNEVAFFLWVQTPIPALRYYIPLDVMLTFMGSQVVMEELKRIDYGVLS